MFYLVIWNKFVYGRRVLLNFSTNISIRRKFFAFTVILVIIHFSGFDFMDTLMAAFISVGNGPRLIKLLFGTA